MHRFNCFFHLFLSVSISLAWCHVIFSSFSNCFVTTCTHVVSGPAVKASYSWAKRSEFEPSLGHQCWDDLSMLISIGLYVFNIVCAARLAIAELPSSATHAVLCSVLCAQIETKPLQRLYCSFAYDIAIFTGVSFGSPNHLNRLIFVKVLHGFTLLISYTFSFVVVFPINILSPTFAVLYDGTSRLNFLWRLWASIFHCYIEIWRRYRCWRLLLLLLLIVY